MAQQADPQNSVRCLRSATLLFIAVVAIGVIWRVLLALRMPVGYDEIFDVALGLLRMRQSAADLLIEVPVERAAALAPLWWWVQYAVFAALGDVSLVALRIAPVVLGILLLLLSYQCARRHFSESTAQVFCGLLIFSDVLAFTAARGEFAESLLLVFIVPLVCMTGAPNRWIVRGLLWAGLVLTHVGKGSFVIALNVAAELVIVVGKRRWRELAGLALSAVFPALGFMIWYLIVEGHYQGRSIVHAVGTFDSFWELLWALTVDYPQYKAHVTGTPRDALQIFLDARVWPLTAFVAPVMAAAVLNTLYTAARCAGSGNGLTDDQRRRLALATWALVGFGVVVFRGTAGARFHLAYLPAAWLLTADVLSATWSLRERTLHLVGLLAAVWLVFAVSWVTWSEAVMGWSAVAALAGAFIAAMVVLERLTRGSDWNKAIPWAACMAASFLCFAIGPFAWAPAACNDSEPMFGSRSLQRVDAAAWPWKISAAEPTESMYVYLANYFLTQRDLPKAEHYAQLATRHEPEDGVAWFYLGLVYDEAGRPIDERRRIWRRALELNPESERVRERWERVQD